MTGDQILFGFAIFSALISAIATIWGMLKETSVKDSDGNKRLTKAGQASLALAIGAALVSITALQFKFQLDGRKSYAATVKSDIEESKIQWRLENQKMYEAILSGIQTSVFIKSKREIIENDKLLSAIADQKQETMENSLKLNQIQQMQKISAKSIVLNNLKFEIKFAGFSRSEIDSIVKSMTSQEEYMKEINTNQGYPIYFDGNIEEFSGNFLAIFKSINDIFNPYLKYYEENNFEYIKSDDQFFQGLVIDLNGETSYLLPLIITSTSGRGNIFNLEWINHYTPTDNPTHDEDVKLQNGAICSLPIFRIDQKSNSISMIIEISSDCLNQSIFRPAGQMTAGVVSDNLSISFLISSGSGFPIDTKTFQTLSQLGHGKCFPGIRLPNHLTNRRIYLTVIPNNNYELRIDRTLFDNGFTFVPYTDRNYFGSTKWDSGLCRNFN